MKTIEFRKTSAPLYFEMAINSQQSVIDPSSSLDRATMSVSLDAVSGEVLFEVDTTDDPTKLETDATSVIWTPSSTELDLLEVGQEYIGEFRVVWTGGAVYWSDRFILKVIPTIGV
jgi:hypothetical protein